MQDELEKTAKKNKKQDSYVLRIVAILKKNSRGGIFAIVVNLIALVVDRENLGYRECEPRSAAGGKITSVVETFQPARTLFVGAV